MRKRVKKVYVSEPRSYASIMEKIRKQVGEVKEDYFKMSDEELEGLPVEDENGLVFYEVGDILLGRDSLIRFVKNNRIYGK